MKQFEGLEVPQFSIDQRQGFFFGVIDGMKDKVDSMQTANVSTGWPASHVNLGWLQDNAKAMIETGQVTNKDDIHDFLATCVQRLKYTDIEITKGDYTRYIVKFKTKDDGGWYCYEFTVAIKGE